MGNTKRKLAFFTIPEYAKEQEWLREQHKKGWKLKAVKVPGLYWFDRCKPEDVVYQLDYNQVGMVHKEEYVQMFQDCGWEYIGDMAGYSYFRKPLAIMGDEEEIFCDDASRLEFVGRVFRGKILPLLVVFFLLLLPLLFLLWQEKTPVLQFIFGLCVGLFVVYLSVFIKFAIQYAILKKEFGE